MEFETPIFNELNRLHKVYNEDQLRSGTAIAEFELTASPITEEVSPEPFAPELTTVSIAKEPVMPQIQLPERKASVEVPKRRLERVRELGHRTLVKAGVTVAGVGV